MPRDSLHRYVLRGTASVRLLLILSLIIHVLRTPFDVSGVVGESCLQGGDFAVVLSVISRTSIQVPKGIEISVSSMTLPPELSCRADVPGGKLQQMCALAAE